MLRPRTVYLSAALLLLTLGAYLPVWNNGFIDWDDELYITANPHVRDGLTWPGFAWVWTSDTAAYWQPLSWLSLQLDAQLFSIPSKTGPPVPSAAASHGVSLFWHAASVLLLFGLWYRLTGACWRSFLVAALFAVHPMHVESVAWAAERKDVLSVFFGLVTLWAYVHYLDRPGWRRYLLMAVAYLLSLLSKPMLMTLPFVMLLLDYWPLRRIAPEPSRAAGGPLPAPAPFGRLLLEKVPLLVLSAGIAVATVILQDRTGEPISYNLLPLSERLANAVSGYGWYLAHTFVPVRLAILYPHRGPNWSALSVFAGAAALLIITLVACWQARRRRWLIVGWLWFVGTVAPVCGIIQVGDQGWADRFTYWPHIGLFVCVAWGLGELVERFRISARVAATAGAAVLVALAALTWVQAGYWRDTPTVWQHALDVTENNHRAHFSLGKVALNRGRMGEAEAHFAEAARIHPEFNDAQYALAVVQLRQGKVNEAVGRLEELVSWAPRHLDAWHQLAVIRMRQGNPEGAAQCYRHILDVDPTSVSDLCGLGEALLALGQREAATEAFQTAVRLNPEDAVAWNELGAAHLSQGNFEAAVEEFRRALVLRPRLVQTRSNLGLALGRSGRWAEAVSEHALAVQGQEQADQALIRQGHPPTSASAAQGTVLRCRLASALDHAGDHTGAAAVYRAALQRDPDWPRRFTEEARALATAPDVNRRDPQLAFEMISQVIQAVGDPSASQLNVLAAAQAALGRYPDAVRTEQRAVDKATAAGETALLEELRERLRHYEKGEPATDGKQ
jgi:tetratricopeptide (TPR) repeat protein